MAWEFKPVEEPTSSGAEPTPVPTPEPTPNPTPEPAPVPTPEPNPSPTPTPVPEPSKVTDEELIKVLSERGITISKLEDIKSTFESSKTYGEQIEELKKQNDTLSKKEIEFKSDKAKALWEFANKHEGLELSAAKTLLNVVGLDLDKADPKQLQFEAFVLQYPNYPREEAKAIFDSKYEKKYGDGTAIVTDLDLKFEHDQATIAARTSIASAVKNYMEAKSPEPTPAPSGPTAEQVAQMEEAKRGIEGSLKDFKGSTINLPEYTTKEGLKVPAGTLNMDIKPEEAARFKDYLEKPESFLRDVIGKFKSEKGMDWNGYTNAMHQLFKQEESYAKIHSQGIEKGMLIMLDKLKNAGGQQRLPGGGEDPIKNNRWTRQPVEA